MESKPVFYDPKGKRSGRMSRFAAILSSAIAVTSTLFILILCFTIPSLREPSPRVHRSDSTVANLNDRKSISVSLLNSKVRGDLIAEIIKSQKRIKKPPSKVDQIVAGFYAPWEESGIHSLNAYKTHLTHVIPAWLTLTSDGKSIDFSDFDLDQNPRNAEVLDIARTSGLRVFPLISNSKLGVWNAQAVHLLLGSVPSQMALADQIRDWLLKNGFQGINLDFESLQPDDYGKYPKFIELVRSRFSPKNLRVTVDIEDSSVASGRAKAIADASDWVLLMAYDEHSEDNLPGPISSVDWSDKLLDDALKIIPANKLVLGLGNFGYDWNTKGGPAESVSFQEALEIAKGYRDSAPQDVIKFDSDSLNSTFDYEDDNGEKHKVWMLDAASAYNQWLSGRENEIRGAGVWALGLEDPGIWSFLGPGASTKPMSVDRLQVVKFPYFIANEGKGEILTVKDFPSEGRRSLKTEPESGLIVDEKYLSYAFPYVLGHSGYVKKKLCLTFDDGPDPVYTPKILDTLKDLKVPGVFFLVGKNAEENSGLVKRELDEGHEVGNHTFTHANLGEVGPFRANLEINATQRAIEAILGKSTTLFRPPYNADSEPSNREELVPVVAAANLHYITVGEKIDPQDWNLRVETGDGASRQKTATDIVSEVLSQIKRSEASGDEGNIILLHDAGGNRTATIEALKRFVPDLERQGYQFVSVAQLLGRSPAEIMPDISPQERMTILLDKFVFGTLFTADWLLAGGFVFAIWLGFIRLSLVMPLALVDHFRLRKKQYLPSFHPEISVVVAAFNERTVIARTIASILASEYAVTDIVIVDDGSTDGTSDVIRESFGSDPRVRLISRANGGKAAALTDGLFISRGDIYVSIDADTQLDSAAIGMLVRHFQDERVAAVAGNVKVGNRQNILTQWQAIEYTTSQNIDRRAYALLNGITVVPGAIGAWRKSAVTQVGAYMSDTLAEDMDLTWRLRRANYIIENEPKALAYTEAPDSFSSFFKQRFRWAYGTLQCLWKHRRALFSHGFFGWIALPALWLFQIVFQAIAPLVDLQLIYSVVGYVTAFVAQRLHPSAELSNLPAASNAMAQVGYLYALFFAAELGAGYVAYKLEGERSTALWWLFLQRFSYRQIMYGVVYKSILRALGGNRQGWGKLDRRGTVNLPKSGKQ